MEEREEELYFRAWLRRRRKALDLTQTEFGNRVGYAEVTIRKIEIGTMQPSYEFAERLAQYLDIPTPERSAFVEWARGERSVARPGSLQTDITIKPWTLPLPAPAPIPEASPYVGLLTFQETDAERFFGRELLVADLVKRLHTTAFLAVLGPSGSGKSSVVRAGLIPRLKGGALEGSESWRYLTLRPGARPLDMLATELAKLQGGELDRALRLRSVLAEDAQSLLLAVETLLDRARDQQFVLVVDQAEELWTLAEPAQRDGFIASLLAAVGAADTPLHIVLTMRADFLHHAIEHRPLAEWIERSVAFVSPFTRDELRAAIERPAELLGGSFEAGLVDELIEQALDRPGALPLLEYTLLELWKQRTPNGMMTWAAYRAIGGVEGALAARADAILAEHYTPEQQAELRAIVLRLVQPGEGAVDTRRRMRLIDLASEGQSIETVQALLKPLIDERLLTIGSDDLSRVDTVELSHEALIRAWPTFSAWVTEARADLIQQLRLEEAAWEWQTNDENEDFLWAGLPLANAEAWLARVRPRLTVRERQFLERSRGREQARVQEARAAIERERRQARRIRRMAIGATIVSLIALGAFTIALLFYTRAEEQRQRAEAQTRLATARELTAVAVSNLTVDPQRSLLLSMAALEMMPSSSAISSTYIITREIPEPAYVLQQAVQASRARRIFSGHAEGVQDIAYSPNGTRLATASNDGTARVWDVATGTELLTLVGHTKQVLSVAFSPDGTLIATASADMTARLWDARTGQPIRTLTATDAFNDLAWSHDGQRLATAGADGTVILWDSGSGAVRLTLTTDHPVNGVAFSPDGALLAAATDDGTAIAWNVATGQEEQIFTGHTDSVGDVVFSPDSMLLATASADGTARVWDVATGEVRTTLRGHAANVERVAFSRDGALLATASADGTVKVWNPGGEDELLTLAGHGAEVYGVAFSPDGRAIATGSIDRTAQIWSLSFLHPDGVISVAFSPRGEQIVTVGDSGVRLWDAASGDLVRLIDKQPDCNTVAFSPDATRVAATCDRLVRLWDTTSGDVLFNIPAEEQFQWVEFSPDGRLLATASADQTAQLWDAATRQPLRQFSGHENWVASVAFSPDGTRLATTSFDRTARVWDVASGAPIGIFTDTQDLLDVAWSPDSTRIAVAGGSGTARVWDVSSGQAVLTMTHRLGINGVAWSADGRWIATASQDQTAALWDARSGRQLLVLSHPFPLYAAAFSPDGMELATTGFDAAVRVFPLDLDGLLALARQRTIRALTADECRTYHLTCTAGP